MNAAPPTPTPALPSKRPKVQSEASAVAQDVHARALQAAIPHNCTHTTLCQPGVFCCAQTLSFIYCRRRRNRRYLLRVQVQFVCATSAPGCKAPRHAAVNVVQLRLRLVGGYGGHLTCLAFHTKYKCVTSSLRFSKNPTRCVICAERRVQQQQAAASSSKQQ